MKKVLQNQISKVPSITPLTKRKYNKKSVDIPTEPAPVDVITIIENENVQNENDNVQNKKINNLIKARESRQINLNNNNLHKMNMIDDLVNSINNEKINNIILKSDKLKQKLIKLI
jgi:hypothetical protein